MLAEAADDCYVNGRLALEPCKLAVVQRNVSGSRGGNLFTTLARSAASRDDLAASKRR
jgi:hypothetical protein